MEVSWGMQGPLHPGVPLPPPSPSSSLGSPTSAPQHPHPFLHQRCQAAANSCLASHCPAAGAGSWWHLRGRGGEAPGPRLFHPYDWPPLVFVYFPRVIAIIFFLDFQLSHTMSLSPFLWALISICNILYNVLYVSPLP